jgi:hypothetical protein
LKTLVVPALQTPGAPERHSDDEIGRITGVCTAQRQSHEASEPEAEGRAIAVLERVLETLHCTSGIENPERECPSKDVPSGGQGREPLGYPIVGGAGEASQARRAERQPVLGERRGEAAVAAQTERRIGEFE